MPEAAMRRTLLEVRYTAVPDTDPEYGQGAIERLEVPHREIEHFVWVIEVPEPGDATDWECRLNEAVDSHHGSFRAAPASEDVRRRVEAGEIVLQK